jgi:hypothetical protein
VRADALALVLRRLLWASFGTLTLRSPACRCGRTWRLGVGLGFIEGKNPLRTINMIP